MLRFLDWQGQLIRRFFTPQNQVRLGALMFDVGLVMHVIDPLVDEPPLIYQMSAGALTFGGIGVVVTAVLAKVTEENVD